jgi:hypothetical protein
VQEVAGLLVRGSIDRYVPTAVTWGHFVTEGRRRGIVRDHIVREKRRGGNDLLNRSKVLNVFNGALHGEFHKL